MTGEQREGHEHVTCPQCGERYILEPAVRVEWFEGFDGDAYEFVIPCGPLGPGYHEYRATVCRYTGES